MNYEKRKNCQEFPKNQIQNVYHFWNINSGNPWQFPSASLMTRCVTAASETSLVSSLRQAYLAGAAGVSAGAAGVAGVACFCWLAPKPGRLLGFVVLCSVAAFSITLSDVAAEGAT